ncbi:lipoxygenase family protein [Anabaena azotica]|uniref:Lipoxygenase n=1 Tax=Anabaena azotica FACHB-119 TaxID=947527 RepID=A0ABR8D5V0_9NOST|nr:lipoxygenase family protein [Anabaena azotica]MBD2501881.1 lipoxygenase [Anabaena azotica FACHB-119]
MSEISTENSLTHLNQQPQDLDIVEILKEIYALVKLYERIGDDFQYKYDYQYLNPLAITHIPILKINNPFKNTETSIPLLPKQEYPNLKWLVALVVRIVVILFNKSLNTEQNFLKKMIGIALDAIGDELNKSQTQEELDGILSKLKSRLDEIDKSENIDGKLAYARATQPQPETITHPAIEAEFQELDKQIEQFLAAHLEKLVSNFVKIDDSPAPREKLQDIIIFVAKLAELAKYLKPSLQLGTATPTATPASSLEDYNNQFQIIDKPDISYHFQEDKYFAYMQVAGPNPLVLQRVTQIDVRLPITEDKYSEVANYYGVSDNLNQAIAEGRIYLADYTVLDTIVNGNFPVKQKYISAPLALFAVPPSNYSDRSLFPVAISYQQTSISNDWIVFTPLVSDTNADTWMTAKNIVQMADGNYHELISHLGRTHLVVEPFVVATNLLPDNHSLKNLLKPHLEGTVLINYGAHALLVAPKNGVDELLAGSIGSDQALAAHGTQSYLFNFNDIAFPNTLKNRGVDDASKLPTYPYRDDGLLIWQAIETWVRDYFNIYYPNNSSVLNDEHLQTWASTLSSQEGGRLQNFGDDGSGRIQTLDYLVKAVSTVIFTASAQHAAVNFPQKELMMYAPAFPLARYVPAPTNPQQSENFFKGLPPLEQSLRQIGLLYLLGSIYYTNLGNYSASAFPDPNVKPALDRFQTSLKYIEQQIHQRNSNSKGDRIIPYEFLLPTKIPQSINI